MVTAAFIGGIGCGLLVALVIFVVVLYVVPTWRIIRDIEPPDFDRLPKS